MSNIRTLYKQTSHYLGGKLLLMLLGFVSFSLFTRVFSVADYGAISLVMNTILVLTAVSKLGLQHSVQRFHPDFAAGDPSRLRLYFSTLFLGSGAMAALVVGVFSLTIWTLPLSLFNPAARQALFVAAVLIFIRAVRSMQANLMQIEERTKLFNFSEIFMKAATVGLVCALLFRWERTVRAFFVGTIAVEGLILALFMYPLLRRHLLAVRGFDSSFFGTAVRFSLPLMAAELAWLVLDSSDRFLIQHYLGSEALGYYAAAYGISGYVQDLVIGSISLAFFPVCLKLWTTKGRGETQAFLSRSFDHYVLAAVWIIVTFTLTSQELIVLLASKKFHEAHRLLPFIVGGLMLSATQTFFKPGLLIHKRAINFARVTLFAGIINIVLNVIMLPSIGLLGAAIATLISYLGWALMIGWESFRVLPFRLEWASWSRYAVAGLCSILVVSKIDLHMDFATLLAKCVASTAIYWGILWVWDLRTRELLRQLSVTVAGMLSGTSTQSHQRRLGEAFPQDTPPVLERG
jgi:O-antigen/teichoic acid export membrane protein